MKFKYYFCCLITLSFLFVGWGRAEAGVVAPTCTIRGADGGPFQCGSTLNLSAEIDNGNESDFSWSSDCGTFDDSSSATPTLTLDNATGCPNPNNCSIDLTVTGNPSGFSCSVDITVEDNIPPQITCPADVTIECDESTDPSNTGQATATDNCDPTLFIGFTEVQTGTCPPEGTITRSWSAIDECGNGDSCTQTITLVPVPVVIDIKPQSCPNPLNVKSQGLLPVAILGTVDLDVEDIDVATLGISVVRPARSVIEDVATPTGLDPCDCLALSGDGTDDLVLKFRTQEIVDILPAFQNGDVIPLTLTGALTDGTAFEGIDCVVIKGVK